MSIAGGPIIQIAWVVDDIAATERLLGDQFGVGGWTRIPDVWFGPEDCTVHGEPADFTVHVSLAYAAAGTSDLQLELIQPVSGTSIYTEFLATSSPGMHHVCFAVEDIDVACAAAEAAGHPVVQRGSMMGGAMDFAYVDGSTAGVPYIELARIGPDMAAFFADVKAKSAEQTA
jgi:catechol 2,3-dioxygenase-like lactoylglutathione lyase family enzyme